MLPSFPCARLTHACVRAWYHHCRGTCAVPGSGSCRRPRTLCVADCPHCLLPACLVYVPSCPSAVYFAVIKTLEGSPELILATLQSKFVPTLAANYVIWPIAHLINFRFVPSE